ncbi:hypothetical protein ACKWTF_013956 [Chironomus riparius]
MGIDDDNFDPPRSHNYIDLDLNMFSSQRLSKPHMITIKRTAENTREFCALMHLQEEKKNLKKYSDMIIHHANAENHVIQKLLEKHQKRQAFYDEQISFHQQTFVENIDDLLYLRNVIENLKERLISIGEENAVREIMGEESDEEKVPNEE